MTGGTRPASSAVIAECQLLRDAMVSGGVVHVATMRGAPAARTSNN